MCNRVEFNVGKINVCKQLRASYKIEADCRLIKPIVSLLIKLTINDWVAASMSY